jgi:putative oxidoreductase
LFGSLAALAASAEMAVSYLWLHLQHGWLPILNNGELAALFCVVFLYIAAKASGHLRIDAIMAKGKTGS